MRPIALGDGPRPQLPYVWCARARASVALPLSCEDFLIVMMLTPFHFCCAASPRPGRPAVTACRARCSPLERPGAWQNVRLHTKCVSSSATGEEVSTWELRLSFLLRRECPHRTLVDPTSA